jgi:hypothetical protein
MSLWRAVLDWWRRTYGDEIARERRLIEEDARRFNGTVIWND